MSRASQLGFIIRGKDDVFEGDHKPMDTGRVWKMLDGIAHMVDESPVYRLNWSTVINEWPTYLSPYVAEFPVTIAHYGSWPNFDVRVATSDLSALGFDSLVRASLITPGTPISVRGLTNGVLGTTTVLNPGAGWAIDTTFTNIDANRCPIQAFPVPTYSGNPARSGYTAKVQLVVEYAGQASEGGIFGLTGVQVREYPA